MDPVTMFLVSLGLKGVSGLLGMHGKNRAAANQRHATTNALTIQQKQKEDARRARVSLGSSLLGGVPGTTAGGGVRTNMNLDPALLAQLGRERTYDFGSAVPNSSAGSGSSFLSGLFGGAAETVPYLSDSLSPQQQAGIAGHPQPTPGGVGGGLGGLTIQDLMELFRGGRGGPGVSRPRNDEVG